MYIYRLSGTQVQKLPRFVLKHVQDFSRNWVDVNFYFSCQANSVIAVQAVQRAHVSLKLHASELFFPVPSKLYMFCVALKT